MSQCESCVSDTAEWKCPTLPPMHTRTCMCAALFDLRAPPPGGGGGGLLLHDPPRLGGSRHNIGAGSGGHKGQVCRLGLAGVRRCTCTCKALWGSRRIVSTLVVLSHRGKVLSMCGAVVTLLTGAASATWRPSRRGGGGGCGQRCVDSKNSQTTPTTTSTTPHTPIIGRR